MSKENEKLGYFRSAANHNDINISNSKSHFVFQQVAFYNWTFKVGVKVPGN